MTLPSLDLVLIIGRGLALTGALLAFTWMFRKWRFEVARDTQRVFEQLDLLRAELMVMHEQLENLQAPQTIAPESRPAPEPRIANVVNTAAPRGYEVGARLARSGASVDELMSSCGLSRHEAALLLRLHGAEHQQLRNTGNSPAPAVKQTGSVKVAAPAPRKSRLSVVG